MQALDFPAYRFKIKSNENKTFIFDVIRKKYVTLTPEEWVRQHVIHFLVEEKKYPKAIIAAEKLIKVNNLNKRFDVLIFNNLGHPEIIIECKSPKIKITQEVFDQIARYNLQLKAKFLMVTNGLDHYFCTLDHKRQRYRFLKELPQYAQH